MSAAPRRVRAIRARLAEVYGVPVMEPHGQPIDELILTVLSQSTNDRNRDVAYLRLRDRFGGVAEAAGRRPPQPGALAISWDAVRNAPVEEVEEAIRPGGISKVKSVRIQAILRALEPLDLGWMATAPVAQSRDHLVALPGVGRKTAACVLLFAFGLREVPVDTHVSRVGGRLGILPSKVPFEKLHDAMLDITPPGDELEFHVNLLRHGRRTCHAQRPACARCDLRRMCPSADQFL